MLSEFDISNYESFKDTIMQPVASIILNNQSPRIILVLYKLASQFTIHVVSETICYRGIAAMYCLHSFMTL